VHERIERRTAKENTLIGYVTLGTNDLERGAAFYDAVLAGLGAKRVRQTKHSVYWSTGPGQPNLILTRPYDGKAAAVGNGMMIGLFAGAPERVDAIHAKALELGAKDEGAAGPRNYVPGFYAGYFRDLDGNKLNVFCIER
jgi:predicted lactoylglutathione lyase